MTSATGAEAAPTNLAKSNFGSTPE